VIIDTHLHLDSFKSPQYLELSLEQSFEQSLSSEFSCSPFTTFIQSASNQSADLLKPNLGYLCLAMSTSVTNWQTTLAHSNHSNKVFCALGIHPWFVTPTSLQEIAQLALLVESNEVSALGEIGLDFGDKYLEHRSMQIEVLEAQLRLAESGGLPVSLHVVKAHNEMIALLKQYAVTGVVHGLGSSVQIAQQYVALGFKIGVNGVVLRQNARRYHRMVKAVGLETIVLETDYPNISLPSQSDPLLSDIYRVAEKVAQLLELPVSHVIQQTTLNAQQLFNLKASPC